MLLQFVPPSSSAWYGSGTPLLPAANAGGVVKGGGGGGGGKGSVIMPVPRWSATDVHEGSWLVRGDARHALAHRGK